MRKVRKYRPIMRPAKFQEHLDSLEDKGLYKKYETMPKNSIIALLEGTDKWLRT